MPKKMFDFILCIARFKEGNGECGCSAEKMDRQKKKRKEKRLWVGTEVFDGGGEKKRRVWEPPRGQQGEKGCPEPPWELEESQTA